MTNYADAAIQSASSGKLVFCKFLSANDTGETGGHQAGIYISKPSVPIIFDQPGIRGENKEKWVKVNWQGETVRDTRFIYYGCGSRNEYRITNFGRNFPYIHPDYTGALFVFVKIDDETYDGFFLNTEDEIQQFLDAFGISPAETNRLLDTENIDITSSEDKAIMEFVYSVKTDFPLSEDMSIAARDIAYKCLMNEGAVLNDPDGSLVKWTDEEYKIFRSFEKIRYGETVKNGFETVDDFVDMANKVLNRRKSRAGKSLEHHLAAIFDVNQIKYTAQGVTEGNKKPDFLFPSIEDYWNMEFPTNKLVTLAAKTTCKDRWRQILNEADRVRNQYKYLATMQQGISTNQLKEMEEEKVILVVPKQYIVTYPTEARNKIWTIKKFVDFIKTTEEL